MKELTGRFIIRFNDDDSTDQVMLFDTGEESFSHIPADQAEYMIQLGLKHLVAER